MTVPGTPAKPFPWWRGVLALGVLIAIGIGVGAAEESPPPGASSRSSPETAESLGCLTPSSAAIEGIQFGLDKKEPGFTVTRTSATVATERESAWFVAAEFTGAGVEPGDAIGIWVTQYDPTTDREQAYLSVDSFAASFSWYVDARSSKLAYSSIEPGAQEALKCVKLQD